MSWFDEIKQVSPETANTIKDKYGNRISDENYYSCISENNNIILRHHISLDHKKDAGVIDNICDPNQAGGAIIRKRVHINPGILGDKDINLEVNL